MDFEIAILLHDVATTLRDYERHHLAKASEAGRPEKAERNRVLAERCETALRNAGYEPEDPEFWERQKAKLQQIQDWAFGR